MSKRIIEVSDIRLEDDQTASYQHTVVDVADDESKVGISGGREFVYGEDGKEKKVFEVAPTADEVVEIEKGRASESIDEVVFTEDPTPLKD